MAFASPTNRPSRMNELDSRPNSLNFKPKKKKKKSLHVLGKQISIAQLNFTEKIFLNKKLFKSLNSYLNLRESIIF